MGKDKSLKFFDRNKTARQFGPLLVFACLLKNNGKTGSKISEWIKEELKVELPSSYIYPLVAKELSGGSVPYLSGKEDGIYSVNKQLENLKTEFEEDYQEAIDFCKNLTKILEEARDKL